MAGVRSWTDVCESQRGIQWCDQPSSRDKPSAGDQRRSREVSVSRRLGDQKASAWNWSGGQKRSERARQKGIHRREPPASEGRITKTHCWDADPITLQERARGADGPRAAVVLAGAGAPQCPARWPQGAALGKAPLAAGRSAGRTDRVSARRAGARRAEAAGPDSLAGRPTCLMGGLLDHATAVQIVKQ